MSGTDAPVHQIVFRWDADHAVGGAGVGPVAWSGNPDGLKPIYRSVAPLLRVPGDDARESLARVELPGEPGRERSVLLIRRIPDQDRGGRPSTCSHALLGSASVLTPRRCLALHAWSWEGSDVNLREVEGRSLECVPAKALREAAEREAPVLTERAGRFTGELTAVLAGRLRQPRQRLSVLDRTGGAAPVHVLWGLRNLAGPALPGWSFATHDTRDSGRFHYVFVPRWPVSATRDQQLTRLDPARPGPGAPGGGPDDGLPDHGDLAGEAALRLVEHYMEHRSDEAALRAIRDALSRARFLEQASLDERVRLVNEALELFGRSHRRSRKDRAGEPREAPREPLYERAGDERAGEERARDERVRAERAGDERARDERYDQPGYGDQAYDQQVFDNMRQDQEQPSRRRTPDRDLGPDRQAYPARSAPPASQAVRAGTGFARDVNARELREALHRNGDAADDYLRHSSDAVLLEVLEKGLPAAGAERLARVLTLRAPHRSVPDARTVCERLLLAHLFLGLDDGHRDEDPVTGPDGRTRIRTAVHLYEELVLPYAGQGSVPGLLRQALPDLWHAHAGRGRAMLWQLIDSGRPTGFGDAGWKALFGVATRPAAEEEPPGHRAAGRPGGRGPRPGPWFGLRPAGRRSRDSRPPDAAPRRSEEPAGRLWVTALLMLIAVPVILIVVILAAGS
ncbi:hypothetical protein [Streptomyces sp. NPDC059788]|uniref:hypothetical protein n=1 Tax=Streptomyces sp. NPDC059788 TaxID=3346948 RepID=UPI00366492AB